VFTNPNHLHKLSTHSAHFGWFRRVLGGFFPALTLNFSIIVVFLLPHFCKKSPVRKTSAAHHSTHHHEHHDCTEDEADNHKEQRADRWNPDNAMAATVGSTWPAISSGDRTID
jgi:hypothetical protein